MINISKIVFALIGLASFFNVTSSAGAESAIKLKNASVERCLNVHGRDNTDGGFVTLFACADTSDQEWDVLSSKDNWIKLKNRSSERCLNIHRGREDRIGGLISVYSCANTPDQDWRIISLGKHIQLQNRSTLRCLNVHRGKHNFNGAPATSYTCANTTDQKWTMSTIGSDGTVNQLSEAVITNWFLNRDRIAEETRSAIQERELADAIASGNLRVVEESPSVEIIVLDEYVEGPNLGDFVVTNESRRAQVQQNVNVMVVGRDLEGLKFIELLDISIEPYCGKKSQNPKGIPTYYAAPSHTIPGKRSETPASSAIAEKIITVTKFIDLHGGVKEASRWCPEDRPELGNVLVRLQAEAGNLGGGVTKSGIATLSLSRVLPRGSESESGTASRPRPTSCKGAGTACMTQPTECSGRGENWKVPGTIKCQNGKPVCVAEAGKDYCNAAGGICGGNITDSCSESNLCAPRSTCAGSRRLSCRSLTIPETSTGQRACTPVQRFCWLPSEVGQAQLGCSNL